jgi:hypothetical protein
MDLISAQVGIENELVEFEVSGFQIACCSIVYYHSKA